MVTAALWLGLPVEICRNAPGSWQDQNGPGTWHHLALLWGVSKPSNLWTPCLCGITITLLSSSFTPLLLLGYEFGSSTHMPRPASQDQCGPCSSSPQLTSLYSPPLLCCFSYSHGLLLHFYTSLRSLWPHFYPTHSFTCWCGMIL